MEHKYQVRFAMDDPETAPTEDEHIAGNEEVAETRRPQRLLQPQ
jgi:hypothetical protein